jgi:hypothetical protein
MKTLGDLSEFSLWLVSGVVKRTEYMAETPSTREQVVRLVCANSAAEASQKFMDHFGSLSAEYSVSYDVNVDSVSDVIC